MPRTKTGTIRHARHKKTMGLNKGFRGANTRLIKRASDALLHAGQYAYIGRRLRKRDMRALWIVRVSAAVKEADATLNFSRFMHGLKLANIGLNRKMLSELAIKDFTAFKTIVAKVRES